MSAIGDRGPARRDGDQVAAGLQEWLRAQDPAGAPEVIAVERPSVGFSSETLLVDVRRDRPGGSRAERLVVKLPPSGPGIFPAYDFALQARVQNAVAAAGIPAAVPAHAVDDTRFLGAPFLVMPAIAGHIVDEVPALDRWLTADDPERTAAIHGRYVDVIADVNGVDREAAGLAATVPARDNAAELAHWREYLGWYGDGSVLVPALVDALEWCVDHQPVTEPAPSLLWGDVRLGNIVLDGEGHPVAVLDWEMASIGAAEHDLAWALGLEAIQDELFGRAVPGFPGRSAAIARYEDRLGRPVQDFDWYETLAVLRSSAIMTRVIHLQERAGQPTYFPVADNPVLGILARRIDAGGAGG